MKIAVIKKDYSDSGGGAERYARELCGGLAERGNEVFVLSHTFKSEDKKGIHHIRVPKKALRLSFSSTLYFHRNVRKILGKDCYDISYSLSRTYPSDFHRVTESLQQEWLTARYPSYQRFNPRHSGIIALEEKIFKVENTKFVICNSNLTARQVVENHKFPEDRVKVVRNGVDHSEFSPPENGEKNELRKRLRIPDDKFVLLFAAMNFRTKGLVNAIKALAVLPDSIKKNCILIAAGSDNPRQYQKLAAENGLSGNLRFEGRVKKMRNYYASADIFLYPPLYEPFSNVCLEAMACGLPILTSKMNGASEIVIEGVNGYLVDNAAEKEKIASIIAKFAEMPPETRAKFAKSAFETSKGFSWERHIEKIIALFSSYKGK
jgi:UDP-glucose:(heptosyl)LPS alpha-1,3-glucosyltransferase